MFDQIIYKSHWPVDVDVILLTTRQTTTNELRIASLNPTMIVYTADTDQQALLNVSYLYLGQGNKYVLTCDYWTVKYYVVHILFGQMLSLLHYSTKF